MKIQRLDAHDRFTFFTKQEFDIGKCCQDLIDKQPFGLRPFYIFVHARTEDNGVDKRIIWQPRLTRPRAQSNSMLFKAYPPTDNIKVLWIIPAEEMWGQYKKGNLTENQIVSQSIYDFQHNKAKLEQIEGDDLPDEKIDQVYKEISRGSKGKNLPRQVILEASSKPSSTEGSHQE